MTLQPRIGPLRKPIHHALVYANPSPTSFNRAIVDTYVAEANARYQEVIVRDLYAMSFDPLLKADERPAGPGWKSTPDVEDELVLLSTCDVLVLVYPIWFGLPPAILKGYVDRVLGAGYTVGNLQNRTGQPALKGKPLLSFSTSGTTSPWLDEQGQVLSLRQVFDVYLSRGLGMRRSEHVMIDGIGPGLDTLYAEEQLGRVRSTAFRTCAMLASERHARTAAEAMDRQSHPSMH